MADSTRMLAVIGVPTSPELARTLDLAGYALKLDAWVADSSTLAHDIPYRLPIMRTLSLTARPGDGSIKGRKIAILAANGMLGVHPVLNASLAGDHRATDGHRGAQFLDTLNHHLQEPAKL